MTTAENLLAPSSVSRRGMSYRVQAVCHTPGHRVYAGARGAEQLPIFTPVHPPEARVLTVLQIPSPCSDSVSSGQIIILIEETNSSGGVLGSPWQKPRFLAFLIERSIAQDAAGSNLWLYRVCQVRA